MVHFIKRLKLSALCLCHVPAEIRCLLETAVHKAIVICQLGRRYWSTVLFEVLA